jgi:hypothetical protein
MLRVCVTIVGLICAVVGTAEAESLSVAQSKTARPHVVKTTKLKVADSKSASLGDIHFSDPYAPPVGVQKTAIAPFLPIRADRPIEPQGGISLTAGRETPDAPFTGGLKFRF